MVAKRNVVRRRELRMQYRVNVRKSMFLSQYIEHKYPNIYSEATEFFNALDRRYPLKRDLTKTVEYKAWKNIEPSSFTPRQNPETRRNIEPSSFTPRKNPETRRGMTNFELKIPLMDFNAHTNDHIEGISPELHTETAALETIDQGIIKEIPPELHIETAPLETIDEGIIKETVTLETIDEGTFEPIEGISPDPNTLQTLTDQINLTDEINPSILEGISPQLLNHIMEELQADPHLNNIFNDLQQDLDMDIDIDYPLESELLQW